MRRFRSGAAAAGFVAAALLLGPETHGVIIHSSSISTINPAAHTVAPVDDPGWENVGWGGFGTLSSSPGTAVYLGNGWALTAQHTSGGGITLFTDDAAGGTRYNAISGSIDNYYTYRLKNPDSGTDADLRLFKLNGDPGLPTLHIAASAPTVGQQAMLIGTGVERASTLKQYVTNSVPPRSTEGYDWALTRDKVWGNNVVDRVGMDMDYGTGVVRAFEMDFNKINGEAVATGKDSGSAVFTYNTDLGRWELGGITIAAPNTLQNSGTFLSHFGNEDFSATAIGAADLSMYRNQIAGIIALDGDFNADGIVDQSDLTLLLSHWGESDVSSKWLSTRQLSGVVDQDELTSLLSNWGAGSHEPLPGAEEMMQSSGYSGDSDAAVPEPASLVLLAGASLMALRRRR